MSAVSSAYKNVQAIRTAIKDMGRLRQIVTVLTRHGFGALVSRLGLFEILGTRKPQSDADETTLSLSMAKRLRIVIEELGPTFVKLGQILSTRPDLIRPDIIVELQKLQDDVPPMKLEVVRAQIEAALGKPIEDVFASFEEEPLASASVAQVHRATLPDGTEVVIKVQRANIQKSVASDLNILQFLAARAEQLVTELQLIDPVGIVVEFERALTKELDFRFERGNIERFGANFAEFEGVSIPRVYPEHCHSTLLVMDYVRGVKATEAPSAYGVDPYPLASIMVNALLKMVFRDGLFHGDLHPGNIIVREDDHGITLIDFGLVGRLLPRQREVILDLLIGLSNEDYELITRVFFEIGVKVPGVQYDYPAFESDVIDVLETHIAGKSLEEIEIQGFFAGLINGAIRHQIKMPPTYTMVFKALMTVEGIGKTLSPKLNFVEEIKPFVKDLLLERYNPERLLREGVETLTSASRAFTSFSQTGPRLLRDVEMGRLIFKVDSDRFAEGIAELKWSTNRLTRAVIFAAAAISGTLVHDTSGMTVLGLPAIAFGAYALAAVAGLPLIFSLLSRK